jgi:hypothetical protein
VVRRYAGDDARQVVLVAHVETELGGRRWPRRRPVVAVAETRATVIDATPHEEGAARTWVAQAGEPELLGALAVLNRAVHGHGVAAADPYVAEVAPWRPLRTRVGYGAGEDVAEGRWARARELPAPEDPRSRTLLLRPQERLAALLSGRAA